MEPFLTGNISENPHAELAKNAEEHKIKERKVKSPDSSLAFFILLFFAYSAPLREIIAN